MAKVNKNIIATTQEAHEGFIAALTLEMAGFQGLVSYTKARSLFGKVFTDAARAGEIQPVMSGNSRKYRLSHIWKYVEGAVAQSQTLN